VPWTRAPLHALVRLGETERAEQVLAGLGEQGCEHGEARIAAAALRLAQDDPYAAAAALEPVLDGPVPVNWRTWPTTGSVGARSASALGVQAGPALSAWRLRMSGCRYRADLGRWLPPPAG
jgi:LuxR family transcriptional regulator, maltose regulon positive regulatory protein